MLVKPADCLNTSVDYLLGSNLNSEGKLALLVGGEKGHPDEKDIESARVFAKGLLNYNFIRKV